MCGDGAGIFIFPVFVSAGGAFSVSFCTGHPVVSAVGKDTEKDTHSKEIPGSGYYSSAFTFCVRHSLGRHGTGGKTDTRSAGFL